MDIGELNQLYDDAESCDAELFAEQRSNILLVSGNHYAKRGGRFWANVNTLRRQENITRQQKIRLTKNHIQKITKTYVNNILTFAPGVTVAPKNESELSDQKAAELNNSVWAYIKEKENLKSLNRQLAHDYIELGEAAVKVFFDPQGGPFKGYEPVYGEDGNPVFDENGEPQANPVFHGAVKFERILAFNLLRDPSAKAWNDSRYVCYRKMVPLRDLRRQFKDDEDKLKMITESSDKTYQVFDGASGSYKDSDGLVMVREFYFRPNGEFPDGYYYITTENGILFEGVLPLGVFPIIYVGFDEFGTSCRAYSIIKQLRPYQAEVNRSASKIAEHQITLGDDKVILQNGGSITPGGTAHGIKAVKVTGTSPTVMPGRNGEQFLGYMSSQISEMYAISNVEEDSQEKMTQVDPYALLFRGIREKKKFVIYGEKFQEFMVAVAKAGLRLAKAYFPADAMIPVFGRKELVNIPEWKSSDDLCYQIVVEPQTEDAETKMGRQLSLNHILQYAGNSLEPSDMGKVIRSMPYVNEEEIFSDLTIDYDNATNDILAMDRGQFVPPNKHDNHEYIVKRLVHRMKQADFKFLSPQIQQMYDAKLAQHEKAIVIAEREKQAAASGYIPSGGYLISCDFYVPSADPTKLPKRARVPFEALQWLLKKLEEQGMSQKAIQAMDSGVVQDMNRMGLSQQANPQGQGVPPTMGQGRPMVMNG